MLTRHNPMRQRQEYGSEPLAIRKTNHYQAEYIQSFVEKWDELIDWERRAESEGRFFIDLLASRGKTKVLDVATGTGFHSVQLLRAGFDVTSADGNASMLVKAFDNARKHDFVLRTVHADWRWLNRSVNEKFDAIVCLGNSFTHLFSERERRRALAEFYAALRVDGVLVLDQRNYDAILESGFKSQHKYYYCGHGVTAQPEHVDDGLARFQYRFPDGSEYHLNMFPLRKEYSRRLMREVGFQTVDTYGDFKQDYRDAQPDFFIHVADKTLEAEKAPNGD
ncbi:MAG TPA: class I SAM-dependent methyltransferase [Polyangiaceae bacterium]